MISTKVVVITFLTLLLGAGATMLSGLIYFGSVQVQIREDACLKSLEDLQAYRETFWFRRSVYNLLTECLGLPNIASYREPSTYVCSVPLPFPGQLWLNILQILDKVTGEECGYHAVGLIINFLLFATFYYIYDKYISLKSVRHVDPDSLYPPIMENDDNACYINASVQALFSILVNDDLAIGNGNPDCPTNCQIAESFKKFKDEPHSQSAQLQFKRACKIVFPQFTPSEQQDAEEFVINLLNALHDDHRECGEQTSKISRRFFGTIRLTLTCESCGHHSERDESFLTLSLSFPPNKSKESTTLEELLEYTFSKPEKIEGFRCIGCDKIQTVVRREKIHQLPPYLIVQLNRFTLSETTYAPEKNSCHVAYPEMLKLRETNSESLDCNKSYEINGTIQHLGLLDNGHYVATVKKQDNWFLCNDRRVQQIPEDHIRNECPYLLFYKLQECPSM